VQDALAVHAFGECVNLAATGKKVDVRSDAILFVDDPETRAREPQDVCHGPGISSRLTPID
jgi:hypothetical protein